MTVAEFLQPNYTTQSDSTAYPLAIDASIAVVARTSALFASHEQSTPDMTVRVDAGAILNGITLTEVAAQSTGTITAPVTNPRIDRIVIDQTTGAVSVITGSEGASPSAPAITAGKFPVAQVLLATSSTEITNSLITDERVTFALIEDADTAKLDVAQDWTADQRPNAQTVTDGTINIASGRIVNYTPSGADTLEFTSELANQQCFITLVNGSNYAITLGSECMGPDGMATAVSVTGTHIISAVVTAAGGGADTVKLSYVTVV